jgi:hypothetical protein
LPLMLCPSLFFCWSPPWCSRHWSWDPPGAFSFLQCCFIPRLQKCLLVSKSPLLCFWRFKLRPILSLPFLTIFISSTIFS